MSAPPHQDREAGIALLMVMLGMIVIGVLALGVVLATRSGVEQSNSDLEASESRAFFDAVVLQAGISLLDTGNADRPRIDGVPQIINVLGQKLPVSITSEFGKVDLNAADADTLSNLFEAAGEGPAEAEDEASQIVHWRSGGNGTAISHIFRVTAEITEVPHISQNLYGRVASAVTVYSGRDRVDESTAPLLALEALPGMDRLSAEAMIRDRTSNQSGQSQTGDVVNGQLTSGVGIAGWAFTIATQFYIGRRGRNGIAVIRMTGDPKRPFFMLYRDESPE